ncbi:succinylglutamate desuccinylase (plasmid) [Bosea sp. F3-2]|uniref:succinylglutamate desuccinylase/aspartoacylase family protein n=1 Tax=Bosea sp. F3-2 TaxID=2599640 RepID=UPI0011EC021F|nr:succinylglutamate desuccinylase/aspartoacylase family protein [Bosea sp. F3-2]QEL27061.1 succinylglutamate desuccinylase [Bosea sp. F3-2]
MKSRVSSAIDFNALGVQSDHARVPYSSDISAYGWIPVPMICFNGGNGPTALFTAGTHGDEYEGQVALRKLVQLLSRSRVEGRVIILPALNQPAVAAGRRNSPLDGGNLNRVFPGNADGGPTSMIAHYVATELFPMADLVVDLHSGGSSLDYFTVTLAHPGRDDVEAQAVRRLLDVFAAPYSIITDGSGGGAKSTLYAAAEQCGVPAIATELGSGATLSRDGLTIAEDGLARVLREYGIAPDLEAKQAVPTQFVRFIREGAIFSPCQGLFEPFVTTGEKVSTGQAAGVVHRLDETPSDPVPLTFAAAGTVAYRRFPTLTATGDALFGLFDAQ